MRVKKPTQKEIETTQSWGEWSKEVSEFSWLYNEKETCYILEGEAEVTADNGDKIRFKTGDWVEFPQGLSCNWRITKDIRKKFLFG
ncbi:MAG: cupin domain-containing protein [Bacteroidales bacterium]|nr:cupin domain-containing protein [Bacteroidales bacterium]MCF8457092.1 cupin domain-containing protein [Bacteroidales bacterium]